MPLFDEHIDLISRYITGELSGTEKLEAEKLMQDSKEAKSVYNELLKIWQKTGELKQRTSINIDQEYQQFKKATDSLDRFDEVRNLHLIPKLIRVAASLALLTGLFFAFQAVKIKSVSSRSQILAYTLPDGSDVSLNRNTKITFNRFNFKQKRILTLSGEAYFDVLRNKQAPFTIKANNTLVEVLGTSFNVKAYQEAEQVEVLVNTGKVAFSGKKAPKPVMLTQGQKATYSPDKKEISREKLEDVNYLSWKTKQIIFDNATLREVVEKLNEVYDLQLTIDNHELEHCRITTSFNNMQVKHILQILQSTLNISYVRSGEEILIQGKGYPKTEIP